MVYSGVHEGMDSILAIILWLNRFSAMGLRSGGTEYSDIIESVHFNFCKYFLGVNNSVNNAVAIGECGRLPLCLTYFINCIKYRCKLLHMPNSSYPQNCYKMLKA